MRTKVQQGLELFAANQPHEEAARLSDGSGKAKVEGDDPRERRKRGRRRARIETRQTRPNGVRKVSRIDARKIRAGMHQGEQFALGGHAPVVAAAERSRIDVGDELLSIAVRSVETVISAYTGTDVGGSGVARIGGAVAVVPGVGPGQVPQMRRVIDLHFPSELGNIIAGAGPVGGVGAQRETDAGAEIAAVVGDFAVVEAGGTPTGLAERAGFGLRVAPEAAILARVGRGVPGVGAGAGDENVRAVVAHVLPGIGQAGSAGSGRAQSQDGNKNKRGKTHGGASRQWPSIDPM